MASSKDPEESAIAKGFQTQNKKSDSTKRCELSILYHKGGIEFHSDEATNYAAEKNGLDISPTYDNDVRCAELISNIAADIQDIEANKLKKSNYLSVMIDGATDSTVTENEAIYVRYLHDGLPVNHLVSVTAVPCSCWWRDWLHSIVNVKIWIRWLEAKACWILCWWCKCKHGPKSWCCCKTESGQSKTDRHSLYGSQAGAGRSPVLVLKEVSLVSGTMVNMPPSQLFWDL